MPVCPGCERRVPHEQLPVHQRCCGALRGSGEQSAPQRIERYLSELDERLTEDVKTHEEEVERRLHRLEDELQAR